MCGKILPARNLLVLSFLGLCHMRSMKLRAPFIQIPSAQPQSAATASHRLPHSPQLPTCACPTHGTTIPSWGGLSQNSPYNWLQPAASGASTPSSTDRLAVAVPRGMAAASSVSLQCGVRRVPVASPASSDRMAKNPHSVPSCNKSQHSKVSPDQGSTPGMKLPDLGMGGDGVMQSWPLQPDRPGLTLGCRCVADAAGLRSGGPCCWSMLAASRGWGQCPHRVAG